MCERKYVWLVGSFWTKKEPSCVSLTEWIMIWSGGNQSSRFWPAPHTPEWVDTVCFYSAEKKRAKKWDHTRNSEKITKRLTRKKGSSLLCFTQSSTLLIYSILACLTLVGTLNAVTKKVTKHWSMHEEINHEGIHYEKNKKADRKKENARERERDDNLGTRASQSRGQVWVNTRTTYCWHCTTQHAHTCMPHKHARCHRQTDIRPISQPVSMFQEEDGEKKSVKVCSCTKNKVRHAGYPLRSRTFNRVN